MGVADRLSNPATGNGDAGIPIAPSGIPRDTAVGLYDTGVNPADTRNKVRASADAAFDSRSLFRDVRPNRVQVVTLSSFGGTDSFTLSVVMDAGARATTVAFVRGTNATAAAIQAELRTVVSDAALVVSGTTDAGPFTITHTPDAFRMFPRYSVNGTGCTGVVAYTADPEGDATIGALGESGRVSEADSILKPTIGSITVTDSVDEIQSVTFSAGIDGGTYGFRLNGRSTPDVAYNASVAEIAAAFADIGMAADAPIATMYSGAEVLTLDLGDIGAADTYKLTYNSVESTALITYASDSTTDIQTALTQLGIGPAEATLARVDANTYTITRLRPGAFASTVTATTVTGFTPLATGGYTAGGKVTTAATDPVVRFTFSAGANSGRPMGNKFALSASTSLTDGGVVEASTVAVVTAGVLGSASIAYTENGSGDAVLAAAISDATGKSFGFISDAASPVVIGSLPPDVYHAVLRTVEDGRVSKADTKAFTVA